MDPNLYSQNKQKINRRDLKRKFKEVVKFLDDRIDKNKPLLPDYENEEVQYNELFFATIETDHFDISRALLKEAKTLSSNIKTPGCGDSKTIAAVVLCSVSIEATLNYAIRYCMHLMGYDENKVYQFLWQLPARDKISIVTKYFKDDEDYRHGFQFLFSRVRDGIEDWAYVGCFRNRLIHHKGDVVHMSISQAKAVVNITGKILKKFSEGNKIKQ